jgi:hypothetical protein
MSDDFEAQIQGKQQLLTNLLAEMEQTRTAFSAAAGRRAALWQDERVPDVVQQEHAVTSKLTDEQLRSLKQDVTAVRDAAPSGVDAELSDKLWWHKQSPLPAIEHSQRAEDPWRYGLYGARQSDTIERALRFAFATVATALEKYGYLCADERKGESLKWREGSARGSTTTHHGRPYYPFSLEWSDDMKLSMKRYAEQQTAAVRILKDIQELGENKSRAEAGNRWKSV